MGQGAGERGSGREMVGEGRWLLEEEEEEEVKMVTEKTRIYRQRSPSPTPSESVMLFATDT